MPTHEVLNQPPPLAGLQPVRAATARWSEALRARGRRLGRADVAALGAAAPAGEVLDWGVQANENPPVLRTHDRYGHRIDEVEFHPAWHELMRRRVGDGLHAAPWREPRARRARRPRGGLSRLVAGRGGHGCPISMTYSAVPALRAQPELAAEWEPRIASPDYDPRLAPAREKRGALCGMAMTEKQGGSDVRANTTRAPCRSASPARTPHRPQVVLLRADVRRVPRRWRRRRRPLLLPAAALAARRHAQPACTSSGSRTSSATARNASSEIEFDGAWARLVGEEGRGVRTIIEMVNHTRLDCVIGSAALMRQAVAQAHPPLPPTAARSAGGWSTSR